IRASSSTVTTAVTRRFMPPSVGPPQGGSKRQRQGFVGAKASRPVKRAGSARRVRTSADGVRLPGLGFAVLGGWFTGLVACATGERPVVFSGACGVDGVAQVGEFAPGVE